MSGKKYIWSPETCGRSSEAWIWGNYPPEKFLNKSKKVSFCADHRGLTHRRARKDYIKSEEKFAKNTLLYILPPKYTFYPFFLSL